MAQETNSIIKVFQWKVKKVTSQRCESRGETLNSSSDFIPGVKIHMNINIFDLGLNCQLLHDFGLSTANNYLYLTTNMTIESTQKVGYSFLQKCKELNLTYSIVNSRGDTIDLKKDCCKVSDENKNEFKFCQEKCNQRFYYPVTFDYDQQCLSLICKIESVSRSWPELSCIMKKNFTQSFTSFLNNTSFSDVTLIVKKELKIPAHKVILSARSAYFEKMFSVENQENEIHINFDCEPFKEALKYIYTQEVQKLDSLGIEITKIAQYYQIDDLQITCENFLMKKLNKTTVIKVLKFSDEYELHDLKDYCIAFIIKNYDALENVQEDLKEFLKSRTNLGFEFIAKACMSKK